MYIFGSTTRKSNVSTKSKKKITRPIRDMRRPTGCLRLDPGTIGLLISQSLRISLFVLTFCSRRFFQVLSR